MQNNPTIEGLINATISSLETARDHPITRARRMDWAMCMFRSAIKLWVKLEANKQEREWYLKEYGEWLAPILDAEPPCVIRNGSHTADEIEFEPVSDDAPTFLSESPTN